MGIYIAPAGVAHFRQVLTDHLRYWGDRDLRSLHLLAPVQEFGSTCLVARAEDSIRGCIFGFVTPNGTGYVHLIAARDDARGTGLGRRLYVACAEAAERHGVRQLKAIVSIENTGSIACHRSLGFDTQIVDDYNGPDRAMAVFHRDLPLNVTWP
nr:GNAT family N-acetyltransferase [Streptomyces sp. N502]